MLATILLFSCIPFVTVTLYFGTRGGYYDTDAYDGHGTAHKVLVDKKTEVYWSSEALDQLEMLQKKETK